MTEDIKNKDQEALTALFKKRAEQERIRNYATSNITILDAAIKVMRTETPNEPYNMVSPNIIILPKPTVAVRELLRNYPRAWSFSEIVAEINKRGVSSSAVNISSSVSSALRTLPR